MAMRPDADSDFVRSGIARELRALYSRILSEAIPENMADLLKRLDQPATGDRDSGVTPGTA